MWYLRYERMRLDCSLFLAFPFINRGRATGTVILIKTVLLDIANHRNGDQVANAHLTPQKQTDLGAAYVVLDELLDDVYIVAPGL